MHDSRRAHLGLIVGVVALLTSTTSIAATPQGFPQEIVLPRSVMPVFLVSIEETFDHAGRRNSETVIFELDQTVSDGRKVRRHFARLFRKLRWQGKFERGGAEAIGTFTDGTVTVAVTVASAGTGKAVITVRVPLD